MYQFRIPKKRYAERISRLQDQLVKLEMKNFVVFNSLHIYYLTGFMHIPTERPFALILKEGELNFFVPKLEEQHVQEEVPNSNVRSYFEYPDYKHPMNHLAEFIKDDLKISSGLGCEAPGASGRWGYEGPLLKDVLGFPVNVHSNLITNMRVIKDEDELACIRESARWGNLAHQLLQDYTAIGANEIDVSNRASHEASRMMRKTLGPDYSPIGYGSKPAGAGYRGQIGTYSAIPHAMTRNAVFKRGDTLVTGASANVAGYLSELERTMFMGKPSNKQRLYFEVMMKAQDAAFEAFRSGNTCADVDKATRAVFKEAGVLDLVQHHTGHSIGLEGHEKPFLDRGLDLKLKPGMVFSIEPGIYDRSIGGFRHSDTLIITEGGMERITYYPRDIEYLVIDS